ncbi:MAG TPA: response regulator [Aliidongia sp.]|nr:response regulator [Aliidongia sp.]
MGQASTPDAAMIKRILVVEDDPMIRLAASSVLEEAGFEVFDAADGEEGLVILRENPSIDLVFTDISMPHMDGLTMLIQARELRPNLKALLTSGLSQAPLDEAFIRKPYRAAAAKEMIVQMLGHQLCGR